MKHRQNTRWIRLALAAAFSLTLVSCIDLDSIMACVDKWYARTVQKEKEQQARRAKARMEALDYEKEGINTEHLFIFTDTTMTYNGKPFMPGMTINEMCEIFGPYEREADKGIYVWDSWGLRMTTLKVEGYPEDNYPVNGILIDWYIDLDVWASKETLAALHNQCPKNYFQGKIIVDGLPLGRGMRIGDFLEKTDIPFNNKPFPLLHRYKLHNWDYSKTTLKKGEFFTYLVRESEDGKEDINTFNIAISGYPEDGTYRGEDFKEKEKE